MAPREPLPPDPNHRRFTATSFPPYRFTPGVNPHPCAHPDGHSYEPPGEPKPTPPPLLPPEQWRDCHAWLYGIDLYNFAYWWETHEVWEAIWQQSDKKAEQGRFIQGMIQIAAAHIKLNLGNIDGMSRLLDRARIHLDFVQPRVPAVYMGIDVADFRRRADAYFKAATDNTHGNAQHAHRVPFPFVDVSQ